MGTDVCMYFRLLNFEFNMGFNSYAEVVHVEGS